jgi:hypothetical protein
MGIRYLPLPLEYGDTDEIRSELLGHTPFSGDLVESTGGGDLGGNHVERSWGVERLDVLLSRQHKYCT